MPATEKLSSPELGSSHLNFSIASENHCAFFVDQMRQAHHTELLSFPEALIEFLEELYASFGPKGVVLVDRQQAFLQPILEIYVLWSREILPINEMEADEEQQIVQLENVQAIYDSFYNSMVSNYSQSDSLLRLVSSTDLHSISQFQATIPGLLTSRQNTVLGSAYFIR